MPSVVFDSAGFVARYPEFANVLPATLGAYFTEATLYLDNTDTSRVTDLAQRALLLNMLTAHVAALNGSGVSGNGASGMVGRINSATEGTVTASAEYAGQTASDFKAWLRQTQYGAAYLAATARYRTMVYVPMQTGCY